MVAIAAGQGLIPPKTPRAGADVAQRSLANSHKAALSRGASVAEQYRAQRAPRGVSLGSAGAWAKDEMGLSMAAAPAVYSSADTRWSGGKAVVPPPRDQRPCAACVAHAIVTAAEAAVASKTRRDVVKELDRLSVQDFYWCSAGYRDCRTGWELVEALKELQARGPSLLRDACLPWAAEERGSRDRNALCKLPRKCQSAGAVAAQGTFEYKHLDEVWKIQQHIRNYGAAVTRFDILSDFVPFFNNPANRRAVYRASPRAKVSEPHAVALIGYNDKDGYWIARQSWGPSWGDGGDFKVAYETAAELASGDTYGVIWTPSDPSLEPPLDAAPGPKPGCFKYTASANDYLEKIALRAGVALEALVRANQGAVADLRASLAGVPLVVCPPNPGAAVRVPGGSFLLRSAANKDTCMDDGGGFSSGCGTAYPGKCDPKNNNQIFSLDGELMRIPAKAKASLCIDGGARMAGMTDTLVHMWTCDQSNDNQHWRLSSVPGGYMVVASRKDNTCLDAGAQGPFGSMFRVWACDPDSPNQVFELVPVDTPRLLPLPPPLAPVLGPPPKSRFLLRSVGNQNLCMDDGGGLSSGCSHAYLEPCNFYNQNQVFAWDGALLRVPAKNSLCIDDGGAQARGQAYVHIMACDRSNLNQQWSMRKTPRGSMIIAAKKQNLCLDSNGLEQGKSRFWLWDCDETNVNQLFELAPVAQP